MIACIYHAHPKTRARMVNAFREFKKILHERCRLHLSPEHWKIPVQMDPNSQNLHATARRTQSQASDIEKRKLWRTEGHPPVQSKTLFPLAFLYTFGPLAAAALDKLSNLFLCCTFGEQVSHWQDSQRRRRSNSCWHQCWRWVQHSGRKVTHCVLPRHVVRRRGASKLAYRRGQAAVFWHGSGSTHTH